MPPHLQVSLDCYVRATADGELVNDIINTVHTYEKEGLLTEYAVEFWPDEVRLTDDTEGTDILTHYREFQTWAESEGVSLEPAFTRRERTPLVSDDTETFLRLPVLCLAIYNDGDLVSVAPHTTSRSPYTVRDALADISSLPRVRSTDISEVPPGHPVRSVLRSESADDLGIHNTDQRTHTDQ